MGDHNDNGGGGHFAELLAAVLFFGGGGTSVFCSGRKMRDESILSGEKTADDCHENRKYYT